MANEIKIFRSKEDAREALPLNIPRKLVVDHKVLCIVRTKDGIFVTDDECPHNKASLSGGKINAYMEIVCPLHEYRYDLKTGRESSERCRDLQTYVVVTNEEGVFIKI